jgi:hypothetical protein
MTDPHAIDTIVRQHLVQQFTIAEGCIQAAQRELQRLDGWIVTHSTTTTSTAPACTRPG